MKDNKQHDKDKVFRFLKRYITISMISILLIISVIFFFIYHNLEISRITGNSTNSLLQISFSCDSLFDSIRKVIFQIYSDGDINTMVNDLIPDATTTLRSYGRLSSYSSTGTNITSIYVYGKYTDCFYTTLSGNPRQTRTDFFDKEAVTFIDKIKKVKALYPIPRKIKLYGAPDVPNNMTNVYSFIYYGFPGTTTGYYNKVAIVNVSEEWVKKSINLWNKGMGGSIFVINEEGTTVSSLNGNEMLEDLSQEVYISKVLKSKDKTGYFVCSISGVKSLITYVYSGKLGWYFIRIIPYSSVYDTLQKLGLITCLLLLLYIAIGFVLSYIITGKAKRSIDDIIDGLKQQIKDNRSDFDKLKEEFLYNSLSNNISVSREQVAKDFAKYNIALSPESTLLLALLRIDHYHELCAGFKSYEITLLRQAVIKMAYETFNEKYAFEAVDMKDDLVVLAFNDKSSGEHTEFAGIDDMIRLFLDSIEKNIQLSLSAVLSPAGYTFNDTNLLFTEVRQASNYRMFYGHKCIIHSEAIRTLESEDFIYPAAKEKMLLDTLMLGKVEPAGKLLDEILYSTTGYPYTVLNSLLLRLTASIGSTFESIENISKYSIDYNFNSFAATLNKCETIDEIRSMFYDMFNNVFTILEEKKNSKYGVLINNAIDIINQDYADQSLCLSTMAVKLDISPGYLGKIFKTYTSKSVADYINKIRVDKALQLLEECKMPINQIAAATGFSNKNYFYTIFKRVVGVTPTEYRQKVKK